MLEDNFDALREPFRVLSYPECLSWLLDHGAGRISAYERRQLAPRRTRLPFVPSLGQLRITEKAQVEHRAFGHDYGQGTFPSAVAGSPTGMRLLRRTGEISSSHCLVDTYSSPRNAELSRRIVTEGATDHFVSLDESTWHVALSIEPRQRIVVRPLTDEAREFVKSVRIAVRPYIHVYPHGGLTVTLCLSLRFVDEATVDDVIQLVKLLTRLPSSPAFSFAMRGVEAGSAHDVIAGLASVTAAAIVPEARAPQSVHLDYALSVGASKEELSDAELSGLLSLDGRYAMLKASWVEAQGSLYGKFSGDRVVASRSSLAVATAPEQFSPSGRRRFFWRCHAIKELAVMQSSVLYKVTRRLAKLTTVDGPDEATVGRLIAIAEHLIEFPRGLPAHHRKWFYECQELVGGESSIESFYGVLAALHRDAEQSAMMRRMDEAQGPKITLNNSQVGTLNLGTIIGDVETHLAAVVDPDAGEVVEALREFAEIVANETSLGDEDRREMLEGIDLLAQEAATSPAHRRSALARSVLTGMGATAAAGGSLATIWSTVGPTVLHFFGG